MMCLCRPLLPDYQLDFGPVIMGTTVQRSIAATNGCCFPVSFVIDQSDAINDGFMALINMANELPPGDSVDIIVTFDPRRGDEGCNKRVESTMLVNVRIFMSSRIYQYNQGVYF